MSPQLIIKSRDKNNGLGPGLQRLLDAQRYAYALNFTAGYLPAPIRTGVSVIA